MDKSRSPAVRSGGLRIGIGAIAAIVWLLFGQLSAAEISVAAASDLNPAIREIAARFEAQGGHHVRIASGSSGNFYAQIVNGAPFDLFLSADINYARSLEQNGLIVPGSLRLYGIGRLVVWVPKGSTLPLQARGIEVLADPSVRKIAIANPVHAPYGRAAEAALRHFGLYDKVQPRLILGESVSQAAQFVQSGGAEAGIIALSVALSPQMRQSGDYREIPASAYPALEQAMVVLKTAQIRKSLGAAQALADWIAGPEGKEILGLYGFTVPPERPGAGKAK